jgi:O-antigen ligase
VHVLAALPLLDILVGQVQSQWEILFGPLSFAQIYHAIALLSILVILFANVRCFASAYRFVILPIAFFLGGILLSAGCVLTEGKLSLETVIADFQIVYWLVFWLAVIAACTSARDCRVILGGIIAAGIYAGFIVIYLYFSRGEDASIYEDLVGNAAGFHTAKGLTGILATAGLAGLWLFRKRAKLLGIIILFVCIAGMLLTYQRAGLVGFVVAVAWLAVWYARAPGVKNKEARWVLYPIVILAISAVVILGMIGTSDLEKRWEDISDDEKAGSGRIAFWNVAVTHYAQMDLMSQVSGIGYAGMADALERRYGARIHTHNDFLDVILMFGAVGLLGFVAVHFAILRMIRRSTTHPTTFATVMGVYLMMFCQCMFTGQILGPTVMSCYLAGITCMCLHARYQMQSDIKTSLIEGAR